MATASTTGKALETYYLVYVLLLYRIIRIICLFIVITYVVYVYMCIGEMTQMAGRAGRRGKDKVGTVIIAAWSDLPFEPQLQQLLTGLATKLVSKFRSV